VVRTAALPLPSEHRQRYRQEFLAELYGMTPAEQRHHVTVIVSRIWTLWMALTEPERPTHMEAHHGQALAVSHRQAPSAAAAQPRRRLVPRMPRVRKATRLQRRRTGSTHVSALSSQPDRLPRRCARPVGIAGVPEEGLEPGTRLVCRPRSER
jgi:hypothetical protein